MTTEQAVVLPVAGDLYALPITWVREVVVVPGGSITRLVTAHPVVLGLINLRGEIVPLLDTAAVLGVGAVSAPTFAAVLYTEHGLVGLAATACPERVFLEQPTGPSELTGSAGTYRVARRVVTLLDPSLLLTPDHLHGAGAGMWSVRVGAA